MRVALHLGRQRLVHLVAVAVVKVRAVGETADVVGVAPQQHPRGASVPQAPVHRVTPRVTQQVRVAVPAVLLVLAVDVRRVERHAHLLGPVLGGNADGHVHGDGLVDDRVGQFLGAGVEAHALGVLVHHAKDVRPERVHLPGPQPALAVHAELDRVDAADFLKEPRQRDVGVGHEVVLCQSPDQPRRWLLHVGRRALNPAAIDVVPYAEGEVHPTLVRHTDDAVERLDVLLLPLRTVPDNANAVETLGVHEVRVRRREVPAVLVSENQHERVESVFSERVQVLRPVGRIVEKALEVCPVHRVLRQRPLADGRLFRNVLHFRQHVGRRGRVTNQPSNVQQAVHHAAIIRAADQQHLHAPALRPMHPQRLGPRGRIDLQLATQRRRLALPARQTRDNRNLPACLGRRGRRRHSPALPGQGLAKLDKPMPRRRTRRAIRNQTNRRSLLCRGRERDIHRQHSCNTQRANRRPLGGPWGRHATPSRVVHPSISRPAVSQAPWINGRPRPVLHESQSRHNQGSSP